MKLAFSLDGWALAARFDRRTMLFRLQAPLPRIARWSCLFARPGRVEGVEEDEAKLVEAVVAVSFLVPETLGTDNQ
jgi:hypothetical protein